MLEKRYIYFPIYILLGFILFTELLFFLGPIDYPVTNEFLLILYLIIVNVSLYVGYTHGVKTYRPSPIFKLGMDIVTWVIVVGLLGAMATMSYMWGEQGLSISFKTIINSLINPGEAYHSEAMTVGSSTTLITVTTIFYWASIPLGLLFWKRLPVFSRLLVMLIILIKFFTWMGIGTRKGVVDLFLTVGSVLYITKHEYLINRANRRQVTIFICIGIAVFLFYFIYSNLSRSDMDLSEMDIAFLHFDTKDLYQNLPIWFIFTLSSIMSYLCQGYYALALALDMGILPTVAGGSSWFTIMLASRLGQDPTRGTYMYALETMGIDMSINWHTAYVWLANDMTFIGVPFFMFFVGRFFAIVWQDCFVKRNDLAYIVMPMFVIMIFYLFANNQVFSFMFISFVLFFVLYLFSRVSYK